MQDKVIQTIVMRAKFPDKEGKTKKLRTGKYIAQGSHASIAFLSNKFRELKYDEVNEKYVAEKRDVPLPLTEEEEIWMIQQFTKICLYVDTDEELLDVYNKAKEAGLTVWLITDSGLTEFDGIQTNTCLAIGPHWKSKIDTITKELQLF